MEILISFGGGEEEVYFLVSFPLFMLLAAKTHALLECRLTSTNATVRISSIFESGKRAFTCGDIPISMQLVTTDITLIVSKAN